MLDASLFSGSDGFNTIQQNAIATDICQVERVVVMTDARSCLDT